METIEYRKQVLADCGATPAVADEIISLDAGRYRPLPVVPPATLPLPDEPHIDAWMDYDKAALARGALVELRDRFVQFRFPVRQGMSQDPAYRAATLSGDFDAATPFEPGLEIRAPELMRLDVYPTIAGSIPVITIEHRDDFEAVFRALTDRNEPADVPASVGACVVSGLNNWDRIARYRARWSASPDAEGRSWDDEFRALIGRKEQYQDRLILLSAGPYSGVQADEAGFARGLWLDRSLVIRREHEFTHYFIYRMCGILRQTVIDELLADFVGIVKAFGTYRVDLARRFLGIEGFPRYRAGGRLEYYQRHQPLSAPAFEVLTVLVWKVISNFEQIAIRHGRRFTNLPSLARLVFTLGDASIEACASESIVDRATQAMTHV